MMEEVARLLRRDRERLASRYLVRDEASIEPMYEDAVADAERALGYRLPDDYRWALLNIGAIVVAGRWFPWRDEMRRLEGGGLERFDDVDRLKTDFAWHYGQGDYDPTILQWLEDLVPIYGPNSYDSVCFDYSEGRADPVVVLLDQDSPWTNEHKVRFVADSFASLLALPEFDAGVDDDYTEELLPLPPRFDEWDRARSERLTAIVQAENNVYPRIAAYRSRLPSQSNIAPELDGFSQIPSGIVTSSSIAGLSKNVILKAAEIGDNEVELLARQLLGSGALELIANGLAERPGSTLQLTEPETALDEMFLAVAGTGAAASLAERTFATPDGRLFLWHVGSNIHFRRIRCNCWSLLARAKRSLSQPSLIRLRGWSSRR